MHHRTVTRYDTISFSYHRSPQTSRCKKRKCWYGFQPYPFKFPLLRCWSDFCTFGWTLSVACVLLQIPAACTLASASAREGTQVHSLRLTLNPKMLTPACFAALATHAGSMYKSLICTALMHPRIHIRSKLCLICTTVMCPRKCESSLL